MSKEYDKINYTSDMEREYVLHFSYDYSCDRNAGSDADGNRGVFEYYLEDFELESVISPNDIDILPVINRKMYRKLYYKLIKYIEEND